MQNFDQAPVPADIQEQVTALNDKFTTISSGSLKDIRIPGAYYLTAAVTDKPYSGGGAYILSVANNNNNYLAGVYVPYDGASPWQVVCNNGAWSSQQFALKSDFTYSEVKSQLTPATGITINSVLKQEIGKLVTVYMYITTSSAINALTEIFSGLPTPTSTQNYVSTFLAHDAASSADTYRMSVRDGGKVQNLDALPNGKVIRATFSYFKN